MTFEIRKPEITKNTSTPTKPPEKCERPTWYKSTARTEIALIPSIWLRQPISDCLNRVVCATWLRAENVRLAGCLLNAVIERVLGHLKIKHAVATPYDQPARSFLGALPATGSNLSTWPKLAAAHI